MDSLRCLQYATACCCFVKLICKLHHTSFLFEEYSRLFILIFCSFQINLGIFTVDKKSEFSVLVDRATGGSSIKDGQVELMLHRFNSYIDLFSNIQIFF